MLHYLLIELFGFVQIPQKGDLIQPFATGLIEMAWQDLFFPLFGWAGVAGELAECVGKTCRSVAAE